MTVRIIEKMNLDSPTGHIIVGLLMFGTLVTCAVLKVELGGELTGALLSLGGGSLTRSLLSANDGK